SIVESRVPGRARAPGTRPETQSQRSGCASPCVLSCCVGAISPDGVRECLGGDPSDGGAAGSDEGRSGSTPALRCADVRAFVQGWPASYGPSSPFPGRVLAVEFAGRARHILSHHRPFFWLRDTAGGVPDAFPQILCRSARSVRLPP